MFFFYNKIDNLDLQNQFQINYSFINEAFENELIRNPDKYAISKDSIEYCLKSNVSIQSVFCHPERLILEPKSIMYFRSICCLSQKAIKSMKLKDCSLYEKGSKVPGEETAYEYASVFNKHISLLINNRRSISKNDLMSAYYSNIGTQIEGSWRNNRGTESEKEFILILLDIFYKNALIEGLLDKKDNVIKTLEKIEINEVSGANKKYKGLFLKNGFSIIISSEPDVAIYKNEKLICSIEIKGGVDKAGALERYGATKKSFQSARDKNHNCITILVSNCMTNEMKKRIQKDKETFDEVFDLLVLSQKDSSEYSRLEKFLVNLIRIENDSI